MRYEVLHLPIALAFFLPLSAWGQSSHPLTPPTKPSSNGGDFSSVTNPSEKVPDGIILVKGAWSSASDSATPVPEGSSVTNNVLSNPYFGMSYALPPGWAKGYDGPPPSDSGRYVLAELRASDPHQAPARGSILIAAQDLFFTPLPAENALQFIKYMKDNLQADYKLEEPPTPTKIAGRPFTFFAYWSPVAQLHWYVLATQIRCHVVELVLTSRDTKLLGTLLLDLDKMTLPEETSATAGMGGGAFPLCVKDYARDENVLTRVDPVFPEHKVNPVPVRVIIDRKGKVKHIHFLSAFPDQAKAVTDALGQWMFKPFLRDGQPVEVETGIMFGRGARPATASAGNPATD
jgi:Gram-negative bacterial TonB protein C-terminal